MEETSEEMVTASDHEGQSLGGVVKEIREKLVKVTHARMKANCTITMEQVGKPDWCDAPDCSKKACWFWEAMELVADILGEETEDTRLAVVRKEPELPELPAMAFPSYTASAVVDKCQITQRDMLSHRFVQEEEPEKP